MSSRSHPTHVLAVLALVMVAWPVSRALDRDRAEPRPAHGPAVLSATFTSEVECAVEPFRLPGGRLIADARVQLLANGIARGRVCAPTRLTSALEPADDASTPYVVVSWRGLNVWEGQVEESLRLDLELPDAGWVAIASVSPVAGSLETAGGGLWISEFSVVPSR